MAKVHAGFGDAWGVPVNGAMVSLGDSDVSTILGSISGVARTLFYATGGVALAVGAVAAFALLRQSLTPHSWSQLARIETWDGRNPGLFGGRRFTRRFSGVCLNRELRISVDGHNLEIPIDYIKEYDANCIDEYTGVFRRTKTTFVSGNLTLFDGSKYSGRILHPDVYQFLTPLGLQELSIRDDHSIEGALPDEVDKLKSNIRFFVEREALNVEKIIGELEFSRFFTRA